MIAVVVALKEEVAGLCKGGKFRPSGRGDFPRFHHSQSQADVVIVEAGIGRCCAEEATRRAIEDYRPRAIISAGFAGGVTPGLRVGELLICQSVYCVEGPPTLWSSSSAEEAIEGDNALLDQVGSALTEARQEYRCGSCLSVPQLVCNPSLKRWLGSNFPVDIIDMESYWVTRAARERHIPSLVVRSVLDPVEDPLPALVSEAAVAQGKGNLIRAARYAAARPTRAHQLIRLAKSARAASEALTSFLTVTLPMLNEIPGVPSVR